MPSGSAPTLPGAPDLASTGVFPGPYPAPFRRTPERWHEVIDERSVRHLRTEGWCVVDDFLGKSDEVNGDGSGGTPDEDGTSNDPKRSSSNHWASALRSEIKWLSRAGLVRPNRTHFQNLKNGQRHLFSKPNVFEADLHEEEVRKRVPELSFFFETVQDTLPEAFRKRSTGASTSDSNAFPFPSLEHLATGDSARTVKLQHNRGSGGGFPCHYDNPGAPSKRFLTCILYLNPEWREGDGGELVVTPFLGRSVKIRPTHNRLAVFYSDRVLHSVNPSTASDRFCLTVWIDAKDGHVNSPSDIALNINSKEIANGVEGLAEQLRVSPSQRSVSRAVYREVYLETLRNCMEGSDGCEEMRESHELILENFRSNKPLWSLIESLREVKEWNEMKGEVVV